MPLLEVRGLVKTFGRRRVVDGVDFEVDPSEIVGLLGPNGAGKTTCFRMTCGMIDPDAGAVLLGGHDATKWPMYRRAADGGMGYLAQESSVFRKLTVEQNLLGVMEMLGIDRKTRRARSAELLEQFGITKLKKSRPCLSRAVSGGGSRSLVASSPIPRSFSSTSRSPASIRSRSPVSRTLSAIFAHAESRF